MKGRLKPWTLWDTKIYVNRYNSRPPPPIPATVPSIPEYNVIAKLR